VQKIKTKIRQIRYKAKNEFFTFSHVIFVIILIAFVWWTTRALSAMNRNWVLQQRLGEKKVEKTRLEIEVETLKLEQEYLKSEEYQEYMARSKQNRMSEGETMVILPKNSEAAKNKYKEPDTETRQKSNFELWLDFWFS
jgi:hypothetical protein